MEEKKAGSIIRNCDICGSSEYSKFWERKPWSSVTTANMDGKMIHTIDVACSKCGLVYKNPTLDEAGLRKYYADDYYLKDYKTDDVDQISKNQIVAETECSVYRMDYFEHLGIDIPGKKVLDVGSASGIFALFMKSFGADITSLEPSRRKCKIQNILFNISPVCMTLEDYGHEDHGSKNGQYDMITICDALEHVFSPTKALTAARNLLNDDGLLFIEVPDIWYPYVDIYVDAFLSSAHMFTFSQYTIQLLLGKCGFRISHLSHSGHKKCMLIVAIKDDPISFQYQPEDIEKIRENLLLCNSVNDYIHSKGSSWIPTEEEVNALLAKHPNYSNYIQMKAAGHYLSAGKAMEVINAFKIPWDDDQPSSVNFTYADCLTMRGMAYRELGHYKESNSCFKNALSMYPGWNRYNFIKELIVSGKLPVSFFDLLGISICERYLKNT